MAAAVVNSLKPLVLICGEDDFAAKQRARQLFQPLNLVERHIGHGVALLLRDVHSGNAEV